MSQSVFFAHANGFPSATYAKLFEALAPGIGWITWKCTGTTRVFR